MSFFEDYVNNYLGSLGVEAKVPTKEQRVSDTAQRKTAEINPALPVQTPAVNPDEAYRAAVGSRFNKGGVSAPEMEMDLRTLTPLELEYKYGRIQAGQMLRAKSDASRKLLNLTGLPQTPREEDMDILLNTGVGFVNGLGSVAAWGGGIIDAEAGANASQFFNDLTTKWQDKYGSRALREGRKVQGVRAQLDARDSAAIYEQDERTDGKFVATMKQVGRDALTGIDNLTADPATFQADLGNAAGSLFAAGPLSKGLRLLKLGKQSTAASIGLLEGGGTYQQTMLDVMGRDFASLRDTSPRFRELEASGMTEQEARIQLADETAQRAAVIQAPIGVVTGKLVDKFEGSPFKIRNMGLGNAVVREGVEEAIQGSTGQMAQNYALERNVDASIDIPDGVGTQLSQGAVLGSLSTAAIRAPGAAIDNTGKVARITMRGAKKGIDLGVTGAKKVVAPFYEALVERGDAILKRNAEQGEVSEKSASQATQQAADIADDFDVTLKTAIDETALDDEAKQKGFDYVDKLKQAVVWDDAVLDNPAVPELVKTTLRGSQNKFDAITRLTDLIDNNEDGSQSQLDAAMTLYSMLEANRELTDNHLVDAMAEIPDDHPSKPMLDVFEDALLRIHNTPKVLKALANSHLIAQGALEKGLLEPVSDNEIGTPEGDTKIRNAVGVASFSPLQANPEANDKILYHDERGDISLTPMQRARLRASSLLVRAERERLAQTERLGLMTNNDIVSGQILLDENRAEDKQPSAVTQIKNILGFMQAGETEAAKINLERMLLFAKHMQNKVAALNEHLKNGKGLKTNAVRYEQLIPGKGTFRLSQGGMWVNPNAEPTVRLAQTVFNDAMLMAKLANDMVDIFPELGLTKIETVALDPYLTDGTPAEIKAKFQAERNNPAPVEEAPAEETQTEDAPVETPEAELTFSEAADRAAAMTDSEIELQLEDLKGKKFSDLTLSERLMANAIRAEKARRADKASQEQKPVENPIVPVEDVQSEAETPVQETQSEEPTETQNTQSDQPVETAPEPAETGQSEGGDQSVEVEVVEDVQPQDVSEARPTGLKVMFASLIEASLLDKIFKFAAEAKTRIFGSTFGSPLEVISDALSSREALTDFIADVGKPLNRDFSEDVANAYSDYLDDAQIIKQQMLSRLAQFLKQPYSAKDPSKGTNLDQLLAEGSQLPRFARGKALNIVEQLEDGSLTYNQELLESAVLAGMQWLLLAENYQANLDLEDVAGILGIAPQDTPTWLPGKLNEGLGLIEAKRSLAAKIQEYWGLSAKSDAGIGQVEGVFEAIASELLSSMVNIGALNMEQVEVTDLPVEGGKRSLYIFQTNIDESSPLYAFPQAIDTAVLLNPEPATFIGSPPEKAAPTQLRNPEVPHTKKQKKAIEFEQKTPHYVDLPMMNTVLALGLPNILELFGAGNLDDKLMNNEDRTSKEGLNRSLVLAYRSIGKLINEVRSFAAAGDTNVEDVKVFYDYVFTRVNRMQMLGANNPQASKLMREVVLPTRATIDLSDIHSQQFSDFVLALAQGLGVKVHTMNRESANKAVLNKLEDETKLKPAVDLMIQRLENGETDKPFTDEQVAILKKALGKKASVVSLHAVMEYARYKQAGENELKAFTTSLYVEADGVTNGPGNAMQLITPGRFTPDWLQRMIKVGLKFGPVATSMNYIREKLDSNDLYTTATNHLIEARSNLLLKIEHNSDLTSHENALSFLMGTFLPSVELVGNDLYFERGIAKNPLTITIYGSGARGIAGNIVDELTKNIYEKMSEALQRHQADTSLTPAEAMFPDDAPADAELRFKKVMRALSRLNHSVVTKESGIYFLESGKGKGLPDFDFAEFKLGKDNRDNLIDNMLTLFVEPLQEGIAATIGKDTLKVAEIMRQAVQVQSIALKHAFQAKVAEKLKEKKQDPNWVQEDFLSHKELRAILDELRPLAPMIQTVDQGYYIVGSETANLNDTEFGSALPLKDAPKFRTKGAVRGPGDAGVAGIPALIIGFGDGQMMLELSTMEDAPTGTLKVFDGMHMKLDSLTEDSQKANEAVFRSWMGNPLRALLKSYGEFSAQYSLDKAGPKEIEDLKRALNFKRGGPSLGLLLKQLPVDLKKAAMDVEARHRAMARVSLSVDQMASVGAPYLHKGEISLEGLDDEQVIAVLNDLYEEEYAKLRAEQTAKTIPAAEVTEVTEPDTTSQDISSEVNSVGRTIKHGLRELSYTALRKLARKLNLPDNQKQLFNEVLKTLAARDYTVIIGDRGLISQYAFDRAIPIQREIASGASGFISVEDRKIFIFNTSSETLVHELLHAATYDKIAAYYEGQDLGPNSVEQVRAIQRLEELKKQFLALDVTQEDEATQLAYLNAVKAIENASTDAIALNEFMAWGLSNAKLSELMAKTKASPLVLLAREVVAAIKKLIWGRRKSPEVADDMLSNVRFNTGILMQSKANALDRFARTILFHNPSYGQNDRVAEFDRALHQKIFAYITKEVEQKFQGRARNNQRVKDALIDKELKNLAAMTDMALWAENAGFNLTPQERSTLNLVIATMMTGARLDANVLTAVQEMFVHVSKHLRVEHFMQDPNSLNPNDRFRAERKYNMVMGNLQRDIDTRGRSTVLPMFLGLAVVNDEFRSILAQLPMPEKNRKQGTSMDVRLDNVANAALEKLSDFFSGMDRNSPDVRFAMDALVQRLMDTVEEREGAMANIANQGAGLLNRANDWLVDWMQSLSERAYDAAQQKKNTTNSKLMQTASSVVIGLSGIVNEKVNSKVAEGLMASMNRLNLWQPIQDVVSDLVGRTESNAPIFDMIKRARNMVQRARQQFREHLPEVLASKFTRDLTEDEWTDLFHGLGKTDIAVLRNSMSNADLRELLTNPGRLRREIRRQEAELQRLSPNYYQQIQAKAGQLANYMNTGETGGFLLRNAYAVAGLAGQNLPDHQYGQDLVDVVDDLVSLYALDGMNDRAKVTLAALAQDQAEGLDFVIEYLVGQRQDEMAKAQQGEARLNHYKGYTPTQNQGNMSLIVANDADQAKLEAMSYVRVGDYTGSTADRYGSTRGYYLLNAPARAAFSQGIFQNAHLTAYGVDPHTGYSRDGTAGRITDPGVVATITRRIANEQGRERLMPIFNESYEVIAYERSIDPVQKEVLKEGTNLAKVIGIWRGRQLEEQMGIRVNRALVQRLHEMWAKETDNGNKADKMREYVDVFDEREMLKDPVLKAARDLLTTDTLVEIAQTFNGQFFVRRDMLKDAMGYHTASVGDIWTGTSRMDQKTRESLQKALIGVFGGFGNGMNAYRYLVNAERIIQNFVTEAKILIVVKSVVVPIANLASNMVHMWVRGVPVGSIVKGMASKTAEVDAYLKSRLKLDELEAELRSVTNDVRETNRIEAEMRTIRDSHKRLTIWPLIDAGEFSSISDGAVTFEETALTEGRLGEYIEKLVDRLPESVRNAGRYAFISRDTALFQGLQRSVEYGDFLAKAILFDDLTQRKGKSQGEALAQITEEFVNYDRLPGRGRGYLESMGMMWFYHFKLRSTKIGLSMIRNNPLHALLAAAAPMPDMIGSVGLPFEDNILALGAKGDLGWSLGPGMGFRSGSLNPWFNMVN